MGLIRAIDIRASFDGTFPRVPDPGPKADRIQSDAIGG
jgi:hypothetical protein